uniref:TauD/TfdA-like domain-containing protein n=1 Tax=Bionectria ochroleuca TaxID=29856 RepID=A0A8H7K5E8_BIOOC
MAPSYRQEGVNAAPSKAAGWSANSWDEWAEARETNYKDVMDKNGTGMAKLTAAIHHYGLGFVKNTPVSPEATEELLERIGPVRNTHYGGFYDFVPDLAKADTAYTNIALGAHTDTTYFTEPTGLQAFHMLSHIPHLANRAVHWAESRCCATGSTPRKSCARSILNISRHFAR